MGKKRGKQFVIVPSPPRGVDPNSPQYYRVRLNTAQAQQNWAHLASLEMKPSRYCHDETTQALGIHDDVWRLFDRIGWTYVMKGKWPTYRDLTLEFLSTLSVTKGKKKATTLHFHLGNVEHELTLEELNTIFKIPRGRVHGDFGSSLLEFWRKISNATKDTVSTSNARAAQVRNPVFRYIQRVLASTVFARNDNSGMRKMELDVLLCMMTSTNADLGFFLTEQAHTSSKVICIGGLITPIAEYLEIPPRSEPVSGGMFIDLVQLRAMRVLRSSTQVNSHYLFINDGLPDFPLPNPALTTIIDERNWRMETEAHEAAAASSLESRDDEPNGAENIHSDIPESSSTHHLRRPREHVQEDQMAYFGETLEAIRNEQQAFHTSFGARLTTLENEMRVVRNDSSLMRVDMAQMLQMMRDWQVHPRAGHPPP